MISRAKNAKDAKVTGRGPSSRANARDLRRISPFGRNDKGSFFACLGSWRENIFCHFSCEHRMLEENSQTSDCKNPMVRTEYEKLGPEVQLARSLIRARLKKSWAPPAITRKVGMQQPNIARLEGGNYDRVSLPTVKKIARAFGA